MKGKVKWICQDCETYPPDRGYLISSDKSLEYRMLCSKCINERMVEESI